MKTQKPTDSKEYKEEKDFIIKAPTSKGGIGELNLSKNTYREINPKNDNEIEVIYYSKIELRPVTKTPSCGHSEKQPIKLFNFNESGENYYTVTRRKPI